MLFVVDVVNYRKIEKNQTFSDSGKLNNKAFNAIMDNDPEFKKVIKETKKVFNIFESNNRDVQATLNNLTTFDERQTFGMLLFINATRSTNVTRDYWFMVPQQQDIPEEFMLRGMQYSIEKGL